MMVVLLCLHQLKNIYIKTIKINVDKF